MKSTQNMNAPSYCDPDRFQALAEALLRPEAGVDRSSLYLCAESSDFLRFNRSALRQATTVQQARVTLAVERGQRRAESTLTLGGEPTLDMQRLTVERALLLSQLDLIADDPWLLCPKTASHSTRNNHGTLPEPGRVMALVHELAGAQLKQDLV
ncbi:MAG: hypothetical protein RLZZ598_1939, partial [Pseudomonadota bacterium]